MHIELTLPRFLNIARRGWTSRLAAMEMLLGEASARGDRSMGLEVIENNLPAVRLYEACGFKTERRLVGYEAIFDPFGGEAKLEEVDIGQVSRLVGIFGLDDLPGRTLQSRSPSQCSPPTRAYRLGMHTSSSRTRLQIRS